MTPRENSVTGVYSHDYLTHVFHRGKSVPLPRTIKAMFRFAKRGDRIFLTVVEKKRMTNFIANRLSEMIYERVGHIVEARIPPEALREFHLKNPDGTKATFFHNVGIPNVNKLSLYGPDLVGTNLLRAREAWRLVVYSG